MTPSMRHSAELAGWFAGLAALYLASYLVFGSRVVPADAHAIAAGRLIGAAILPWLVWLFVRWKRKPAPPPSFAGYFFIGTAICLLLPALGSL